MNNIYKNILKPFSDYLLAIGMLVFFSPIFIIITALLFFTNNGKPFFSQIRPGKNEELFNVLKFKTMNDKKDRNGMLLPESDRLTTLGIKIRKTSLDELPQLINVLKGEMSFIGPRPLLTKYLPYYTKKEQLRHTVKPGLTGLAQVSGRNLLGWDKRLLKDVEYVENLSFLLDLHIFFKTIKKVLLLKDVIVDPTLMMVDNLEKVRKKK